MCKGLTKFPASFLGVVDLRFSEKSFFFDLPWVFAVVFLSLKVVIFALARKFLLLLLLLLLIPSLRVFGVSRRPWAHCYASLETFSLEELQSQLVLAFAKVFRSR